jgi:hypothetical protein
MVGGVEASDEGKDPNKKHRHDVGLPDHGAHQTEGVTKTIQGLLGVAIALTAALTLYAIFAVGMASGS